MTSALLFQKLYQHIYLAGSSTLIAILIGLPLGILIHQHQKSRGSVLAVANVFQTIPSLALLAFLIPWLGIGVKPTIVAMTIYALLPIIRNTYTGLQNIPAQSIEAADGLGFTTWQRLKMIELPLAMPTIVAGIRTATAMTIGITTIAAFIGAGGLGDFITQGLATNNSSLILWGAIPAALLALFIDFVIGGLSKSISSRQQTGQQKIKFSILSFIILSFLVIIPITKIISPFFHPSKQDSIRIASKNFTEQLILGNIMADLIEAKTNLKVIKKFNLGSTEIIQQAIVNGDIDLYPEYTGTAYMNILAPKNITFNHVNNPELLYQFVKIQYAKHYNLIWLKPFGYNGSQSLAITNQYAKQHNITTISQLAPYADQLTIGAPAEFYKRADAYAGLQKAYHIKFKTIKQLEPDLMYAAIKNRNVDVIYALTTDGRIKAYHLTLLKDDKHFYPDYAAAPVIRGQVLKQHPELKSVLNLLAGKISLKTMREMNYQVSVLHQAPATVANNFLLQNRLLQKA